MDVLLPVAIGFGAALAACGALVLLRAARWRVQDRLDRRPEIQRIAGWPVTPATARRSRAKPVRVSDESSLTKPVTRQRIRRTRASGITAATGEDSPRADAVRLDDLVEADVQGHADREEEAEVRLPEAQSFPEPQNVYWRTDGSTDCPSCASSRLRGASFCIRCGRRLA